MVDGHRMVEVSGSVQTWRSTLTRSRGDTDPIKAFEVKGNFPVSVNLTFDEYHNGRTDLPCSPPVPRVGRMKSQSRAEHNKESYEGQG